MRRFIRPLLRLRSLSLPTRWAAAALLVALAFAARYLLYGASPKLPYLCFLPAVILSAAMFDRGSGFFATLLSAALAIIFFISPPHRLALDTGQDLLNAILFILIGAFVAAITEALHEAYAEAEEAHQVAERARARAEASERERELLLAEFQHRVGNDLQRIGSMLDLQARRGSPEATAALREAASRVYVIARVHERLAQRDGHVLVNIRDFLHDLIQDLRTSHVGVLPIGLFLEAEPHALPVARAGSVGLIVNELVTNALKHGFADQEQEGAINVKFWLDGPDYHLNVEDDGVGIVEPQPEPASSGMGRRLVRSLAAQLGGHLETTKRPGGGTRCLLRFPVRPPGDAHCSLSELSAI